jgi:putative ABC transport system permease protein
VRAVHPDHRYLENTIVTRGRFLNEVDLRERRKVAAIGQPVAEFLFGRLDPLGRELTINGLRYTVVGLFEDTGGEGELRKIYLPITTAQRAYNGYDRIDQIMFTIGDASLERSLAIEREVTALFADRHDFDPSDRSAVRIRNNLENYERIGKVLWVIGVFVWFVGLGTVVAGVVAVSNIMLISVRERTREFGIRKALGATPGSIVSLVIQEAVLLTAVSGYIGLVLGVALLEVGAGSLPANDFFRNPEVSLSSALAATALLVVFGALAGYFPARRAARINPIDALRDE